MKPNNQKRYLTPNEADLWEETEENLENISLKDSKQEKRVFKK